MKELGAEEKAPVDREDAQGAADVEHQEGDGAFAILFGEEEPGDEEAAEGEEEIDADARIADRVEKKAQVVEAGMGHYREVAGRE